MNAKPRLSPHKVTVPFFVDQKGVILLDFPHDRPTINEQYYHEMLDAIKLIFKKKKRKIRQNGDSSS